MPCGVPKPLRGRPEARRPGVCLLFEEWAEKKKNYQSIFGTPVSYKFISPINLFPSLTPIGLRGPPEN